MYMWKIVKILTNNGYKLMITDNDDEIGEPLLCGLNDKYAEIYIEILSEKLDIPKFVRGIDKILDNGL